MKSARYKLEAFIRDYSDMTEWKEVIEAIKTQLGAKQSDSLFRRRMEKYENRKWSDRLFFDGDLIQFLAWRGGRNL